MDDIAQDSIIDGKTPAQRSVERAHFLIKAYSVVTGQQFGSELPSDEVVIDLIADLKHWVDKHGDHYVAGYDDAWSYFDEESYTHFNAERDVA